MVISDCYFFNFYTIKLNNKVVVMVHQVSLLFNESEETLRQYNLIVT